MRSSFSNMPDKKLLPGVQNQVAAKIYTAHQTATRQTGHINQAARSIATSTLLSAKLNSVVPRNPKTNTPRHRHPDLNRPHAPASLNLTPIQVFQHEIAHAERMTADKEKSFSSISRYELGKRMIKFGHEPNEKLIRLVATGNIHDENSCYYGYHLTPEVVALTINKSIQFTEKVGQLLNQNQIHGQGLIKDPNQMMNDLVKQACDVYGIENLPLLESLDEVPKGSMAISHKANRIVCNKQDMIDFGNPKNSRTTRLKSISSIFHEVTHAWQHELIIQYQEKKLTPESTEERIAVMSYLGIRARQRLPEEFNGINQNAKLYAHAWHEQQAHVAGFSILRVMTQEFDPNAENNDSTPIKHRFYLDKMDNTLNFYLIDTAKTDE